MLLKSRYALPNGLRRVTSIYARDQHHGQHLADLRGMGEEIVGDYDFRPPDMPSHWLARRQYAHAHHAMTWVAMVACRAIPNASWVLLNDVGVMHELAHAAENEADRTRFSPGFGWDFETQLVGWELLIPGVHRDWATHMAGELEQAFHAAKDLPASELDRFVERLGAEHSNRRRAALQNQSPYVHQIDAVAYASQALAKSMAAIPLQMEDMSAALRKLNAREYTVLDPPAKPGTRKAEKQAREQSAAAKAARIKRFMDARNHVMIPEGGQSGEVLQRVATDFGEVEVIQAASRIHREPQPVKVEFLVPQPSNRERIEAYMAKIAEAKHRRANADLFRYAYGGKVNAELLKSSLKDMMDLLLREPLSERSFQDLFMGKWDLKARTATEQREIERQERRRGTVTGRMVMTDPLYYPLPIAMKATPKGLVFDIETQP